MTYLIGHTSPDFDCIGALWLLQRYGGFADAEIRFVNTGAPDPAVLAGAAAVVDTGREYNPMQRRFDHHHLPGAEANATCAAQQVYHWLILARPDVDWSYIGPIIDLIYAGDTGKPEANESRTRGIHALLSARKALRPPDIDLLLFGYDTLDLLAAHALAREIARATLATHTVYRSADGLVLALRDAPQGATVAAYEAGARLVVFANYAENAIGVMRGGEGMDVHCGNLVRRIIADPTLPQDMLDELSSFYLHEAGFFAGRGTAKAPRDDAILVDVTDVARLIDRGWER